MPRAPLYPASLAATEGLPTPLGMKITTGTQMVTEVER